MERVTALMAGRPSSFRDEDIDVRYPQDACRDDLPANPDQILPCGIITDWIFIRIMAKMGKVADCIMSGIYSTQKITEARDLLMETNIHGCESALEVICQHLPAYLDFRNTEATVGNDWQEVQRLHVGIIHQTLRMLVHRPSLVFTTFFSSVAEAQLNCPPTMQLRESIDILTASAKGIIRLAHQSLSTRQPDSRLDSSLAIYLVVACLTLLYEVLDPATTPLHAKDIFSAVEQAIECLEGMKHFGPTTGKTISTDIMRMAKNVLFCSAGLAVTDTNNEFMSTFPWLEYISLPSHPPLAC